MCCSLTTNHRQDNPDIPRVDRNMAMQEIQREMGSKIKDITSALKLVGL
jgi:hypothetical protein